MLLINNQRVNATDFVKKIKEITGKDVPLDELTSNMEFKYNPVKKGYDLALYKTRNMKVQKVLRSDDILASFNVWSDKDQSTIEFRFANRLPYANPKNPTIMVNDPKAIEFPGGVFNFEQRDVEKALYMYVHPLCIDSPFYRPGTPYKFTHNNLKAESKRKLKDMSVKQEAFKHATNVDPDELKVLALGLGLSLIPNADSDDIRAAIQEYALENSKLYLEKTATETIKFEGMIQNAIDTGHIVNKIIGGINTWEFAKGADKGKQIMIVTSKNNNALGDLKLHMKTNIAEYYSSLAGFNKDLTADNTAEKFLSNLKNGVDKNEFMPFEEELTLNMVVDHKTAKQYLINAHPERKNPSATNAKLFLDAITAGEIVDGNVDEESKKYVNQS